MNMTQISLTALIISVAVLSSCTEQQPKEKQVVIKTEEPCKSYDSVKYNQTIIPDTTGCWKWVNPNIKGDDTLCNELVIVKSNNTYRTLSRANKFIRLWPCYLPSFIKDGDTLIVSGSIYEIGKSESMPGHPTLLTKIIFSNPNGNNL